MSTLDPQCRSLLDALSQAFHVVDWRNAAPSEIRAMLGGQSMFAPGDDIASISDISIDGPGGPLRLRVYRPLGDTTDLLPVTLYLHGGGFVTGAPEGHDNVCRCLAARARSMLVSVDYRLAPEAPFPAGTEDAFAALHWLSTNAVTIGGDSSRIAVAGDSAGATLACATAAAAHDAGIALRHQLLLYPVTSARCDWPSYTRLADGYLLSAEMMRWFWRQYVVRPADAADPRASPLNRSDFSELPAATIIIPGFDLTCDESRAYAQRLLDAGVQVTLHEWPRQIHGFASMLGAIDAADPALHQAADALRRGFS